MTLEVPERRLEFLARNKQRGVDLGKKRFLFSFPRKFGRILGSTVRQIFWALKAFYSLIMKTDQSSKNSGRNKWVFSDFLFRRCFSGMFLVARHLPANDWNGTDSKLSERKKNLNVVKTTMMLSAVHKSTSTGETVARNPSLNRRCKLSVPLIDSRMRSSKCCKDNNEFDPVLMWFVTLKLRSTSTVPDGTSENHFQYAQNIWRTSSKM